MVLFIILPLMIATGISIVFVADQQIQKSNQLSYEMEFLDRYRRFLETFTDEEYMAYMPLTFKQQHTEDLFQLCRQYRSKLSLRYYFDRWQMRNFEPSTQIHFIAFRRVDSSRAVPLKVEIIRCSEKYALIPAGEENSGYLLEQGPPEDFIDAAIFHIHAIFYFNEKKPETDKKSDEGDPSRQVHLDETSDDERIFSEAMPAQKLGSFVYDAPYVPYPYATKTIEAFEDFPDQEAFKNLPDQKAFKATNEKLATIMKTLEYDQPYLHLGETSGARSPIDGGSPFSQDQVADTGRRPSEYQIEHETESSDAERRPSEYQIKRETESSADDLPDKDQNKKADTEKQPSKDQQ